MKRKVNILIPIFIILVLIYVVRSMVGTRIQVETLHRGSMEDMVSTKGLMIKYESVMESKSDGVFEPLAQEGARVSVGQQVAAIYTDAATSELRTRLDKVKKKITQIEENQANLINFSGDVSRLEKKIAEKTAELIEKGRNGEMTEVGEIRLVIEALCEKKAEITGVSTSGGTLAELRAQKAELESQIGTAQQRMVAPSAGVFSTAVDGLESVVTPYNMTELTPVSVEELLEKERGQAEKQESVACKIIKNFRYFIAVNLPADRVGTLKTGDVVSLRLYDLTKELMDAKIFYISPAENNQITVILDCDQHVDSLLKLRYVNLEFIKKRYAGYRVSVKSLRTKDDVTGVYVIRDDMLKFIPVTILYNTQDMVIVDSLDSQTPLRLYDEVVVRAGSYEEGKLIR